MTIALNHIIVHARDKRESANFLAELLGLPAPKPLGHFLVVQADNGISLDFIDDPSPISRQHYAFLVSEQEFDAIFGRIHARGLPYWGSRWRRTATSEICLPRYPTRPIPATRAYYASVMEAPTELSQTSALMRDRVPPILS